MSSNPSPLRTSTSARAFASSGNSAISLPARVQSRRNRVRSGVRGVLPGKRLLEPGDDRETTFGGKEMARLRRRRGLARLVLVLAAPMFGVAALIGATGATAGPGVSTTTPFAFSGMNT